MGTGNGFVAVICSIAAMVSSVAAAGSSTSYNLGSANGMISAGGSSAVYSGSVGQASGAASVSNYRPAASGASASDSDTARYYSRGYSSYNHGGYSPSSGAQSDDQVQKETKYYYGGKYQGIDECL
jgi:hypothetical protein